jgi:sugar phosphate isomerase/epimerase
LSAQLAAYNRHGLRQIELGHCPKLDGMRLPADLKTTAACYLVHNYFPPPTEPLVLNLASQQPPILQASRAFYEASLRLSAELGASFYSLHCGFLADFAPAAFGQRLSYEQIYDYEAGYRTFVDSLKQLLTLASRLGLRLLIEPNVVAPCNLVAGQNRLLLLAEPREFMRLLHELNTPTLGVLLDLGHLKVNAATLHFPIGEFMAAVSARIGAFHLHDNDGTADQHQPIAADSWALAILRSPAFQASPVVVEASFPSVERLASHCQWLESVLTSH